MPKTNSKLFRKRKHNTQSIRPPQGLLRKVVSDWHTLDPSDGRVRDTEFYNVFQATLDFLVVKSLQPSGTVLLPSRKVEKILKHFITFTADYRNACHTICGAFIDYHPTTPSIEGSSRQAVANYAITRAIMQQLYGELNQSIWPRSVDQLGSWSLNELLGFANRAATILPSHP